MTLVIYYTFDRGNLYSDKHSTMLEHQCANTIKSTSRQLSHDQSEEDWIEVKGKNEKTPIVTKKRVTYSPASVGTPNRMVICMNEMRRRQKRISVQLGTSQL